jgi:hypothetical protein
LGFAAWHGGAGRGEAGHGIQGRAWHGRAGQGKARQGMGFVAWVFLIYYKQDIDEKIYSISFNSQPSNRLRNLHRSKHRTADTATRLGIDG